MTAVRGRDVDAAPAHEPAPEGEPFRRIVVAADDKDLLPFPGQPVQELVKKLHRLGGGNRLVIDIARQKHGVRLFLPDKLQDLF